MVRLRLGFSDGMYGCGGKRGDGEDCGGVGLGQGLPLEC
jgi:hypothetical protein